MHISEVSAEKSKESDACTVHSQFHDITYELIVYGNIKKKPNWT